MSTDPAAVPVVLFAYARPTHLARVLECLRGERVPVVYAFADGARSAADAPAVAATRRLLREIDWCDVRLVERAENLGLGRNVVAGVSQVAEKQDAFIVWEDDIVCAPGTYRWLCAALAHYAEEPRVMSVTAWTHPRVTPADVGDAPYFDGRAESWLWAAWSRSWRGMVDETAVEKLAAVERRGRAPHAYGADLPQMAADEHRKNLWAVRWLYHHLQHGALCLRPPWSMAEHIGFDATATNAAGATDWANATLRPPPAAEKWPEPKENPQCRDLWFRASPRRRLWSRLWRRARRWLGASGG